MNTFIITLFNNKITIDSLKFTLFNATGGCLRLFWSFPQLFQYVLELTFLFKMSYHTLHEYQRFKSYDPKREAYFWVVRKSLYKSQGKFGGKKVTQFKTKINSSLWKMVRFTQKLACMILRGISKNLTLGFLNIYFPQFYSAARLLSR